MKGIDGKRRKILRIRRELNELISDFDRASENPRTLFNHRQVEAVAISLHGAVVRLDDALAIIARELEISRQARETK